MQARLSAVPVDPELIKNGDFETITTDFWADNKTSATTVFDTVTDSQVLEINSRIKHSSTTKQTVSGLTPGSTCLVSSKLMTPGTGNNIGMAMSYKVVGPSSNTTITIGGNNHAIFSTFSQLFLHHTTNTILHRLLKWLLISNSFPGNIIVQYTILKRLFFTDISSPLTERTPCFA